ncbi:MULTISPECIES: hypothetical protein [unclassified Pseudomonas]|uniref:hypothetical protein n=1 Tax=unclassified Pseudomonas TaxID=196821 RepID=UPI00128C2C5C|nr:MULTISPECIES: hypothetical protein [unclassified Pseudomonas]MPQ68303.1 hypothetical protein [Pseudomonas sp. MWU12-2323]
MFTKIFNQDGTFQALYAAQRWLASNGYSYGPSSAMNPIPVLKGDVCIAKWKNLTREEVAALDGQVTGNLRDGPITVTLNCDPTATERAGGIA